MELMQSFWQYVSAVSVGLLLSASGPSAQVSLSPFDLAFNRCTYETLPPNNSFTAFMEAFPNVGWTTVDPSSRISPFDSALLAVTFNEADYSDLPEKIAEFQPSRSGNGDIYLTNYSVDGIQLALGLPLVGMPICAFIGDRSEFDSLEMSEANDVNIQPENFSWREIITSNSSRTVYVKSTTGSNDLASLVFLTVIDKPKLLQSLNSSALSEVDVMAVYNAIPETSIVVGFEAWFKTR